MSTFTYGLPDGPTDVEQYDAEVELDADVERPAAVNRDSVSSMADILSEEFGQSRVPTTEVPIPGRNGWFLGFRLDWTETATRKWQQGAKEKGAPNGLSLTKLYAQLVVDQCVDVLKVDSDDGRAKSILQPGPMRKVCNDPLLQEALGVSNATGVVRKFMPVFSQLQAVANTVSSDAGQGEGLDPTQRGTETESDW